MLQLALQYWFGTCIGDFDTQTLLCYFMHVNTATKPQSRTSTQTSKLLPLHLVLSLVISTHHVCSPQVMIKRSGALCSDKIR